MPGIDALKRSSFASASSRKDEEDVGPRRAAEHRGQLALERTAGRVVEEVLLGLVEQEEDVSSGRARPLDGERERVRGLDARLGGDGLRDRCRGALRPGREHDDDGVLRQLPQAVWRPRRRGARTCRRRSGRTARSTWRRRCSRRRSRHRARGRRRASRRSPCRRTASVPCTAMRAAVRSSGRHSVEPAVEQARRTRSRPARRRGRRGDARTRARAPSAPHRTAHDAYGAERPPRSRLTTSRRFQSARS